MMRKWIIVTVAALSSFLISVNGATAGTHLLGGGIHYNESLTNIVQSAADLDTEFNADEFSWLLSYQYIPASLLKFEADVEFIDTGDLSLLPQIYALLGAGVYGGVGIGLPYVDNEFADDPVYNLRAGLDVQLIPDLINLDVNANYGFNDFAEISDINEGNITLGLIARLRL